MTGCSPRRPAPAQTAVFFTCLDRHLLELLFLRCLSGRSEEGSIHSHRGAVVGRYLDHGFCQRLSYVHHGAASLLFAFCSIYPLKGSKCVIVANVRFSMLSLSNIIQYLRKIQAVLCNAGDLFQTSDSVANTRSVDRSACPIVEGPTFTIAMARRPLVY